MKKAFKGILSVVAVIILGVCMSACSTGITGTYKFSKMTVNQGGVSMEVVAGESFMGVTVNSDAYVLTVKDDNTFELVVNMGEEQKQSGTWEEKDGKYYFTVEGESIEVTLNGNTITFEQEGARLELKK